MLTLPIKQRWMDKIVSREKLEEYRAETTYYEKRFANLQPHKTDAREAGLTPVYHIRLRAGYRKDSPSCIIRCTIVRGYGRPEWGAEPGVRYFKLKILDVEMERSGANDGNSMRPVRDDNHRQG